jgi:hypothetical protein
MSRKAITALAIPILGKENFNMLMAPYQTGLGSANANAQGLSNIGGAVSGLGGSLQQNLLLNKLIGAQNPYGTDSQGNPYTVGDGSDDLYTSDASDYAGMGG